MSNIKYSLSDVVSEVSQMANIFKITEVLSLVLQILCIIGAVGMFIGGVVFLVYNDPEKLMIGEDHLINVCGMAVSTMALPADKAAQVMGAAMIISGFLYILLSMVFRNINLIVRTSNGETWFSKGATPFQDDNIRKVREIGIFLIFIYIIGLVGTMIVSLINENVETSTSMMVLFIGIIVICLSKIFEYGKELQDTEDGLI